MTTLTDIGKFVTQTAGIARDDLIQIVHAHQIRARRYFFPGCHRMQPYRTLYPDQVERLPETDLLCQRVLLLTTGTAVSAQDIERVCAVIRRAMEAASVESVRAK